MVLDAVLDFMGVYYFLSLFSHKLLVFALSLMIFKLHTDGYIVVQLE